MMGQDTSSYHVIGSEDYEFFATMISEMQHRLSILRQVQGGLEEE